MVWLDPDGTTNILSFKQVREKCAVRYDSKTVGCFVVTKPDRKVFMFEESLSGLHYLATEEDSGTTLVNTVDSK